MIPHRVTFGDWDHYTDGYGTAFTLDWSAPAAMRGRFSYPYIEAIRQALNERMLPFGHRLSAADGISAEPWMGRILWSAIGLLQTTGIWPSHATPLTAASDTAQQAAWAAAVAAGTADPQSDYLTHSTPYGGTRFQTALPCAWVDPALLPTLHNRVFPWPDTVSATAYCGQWLVEYPGVPNTWDAGLTRLLDAAGITTPATRAFFLTLQSPRYHFGGWPALLPASELVWTLRQLLSRLTCCVCDDIFVLGAWKTAPSIANLEHRYTCRNYGTLSDAIAAFNAATAWTSTPPANSFYPEYVRHVAGTSGGETNITLDEGHVIARSRADCTWHHPARVAITAEQAVWLSLFNPMQTIGRPYFQSQDYPDITGVATGEDPGAESRVAAVIKSSSIAAGTFTTQQKIGDFADCSVDIEVSGINLGGWYAYPGPQRWDFAVPGGFTFR